MNITSFILKNPFKLKKKSSIILNLVDCQTSVYYKAKHLFQNLRVQQFYRTTCNSTFSQEDNEYLNKIISIPNRSI